ncbi:S41 family peptidase [uncultured Sunxiuqinia sp.]|uniref:S41 family peptidase n=1 Tax=uncultured Sunxiuqinia sp. TaxID=1573825 RepID=UPI00262F5E64|nr:S41 family peptidase [uncultured Sunxiuqinia sp.]
MRIELLLILVILSLSCKREQQASYEPFFEQAFSIIKNESIKKNETDWEKVKETIKDSITHLNSNDAVYDAIGYLLTLIDDGHSSFADPHTPNKLTIDTFSVPTIESRIINEDIAYIKLPGFTANDSLSRQYALSIRKSLLELDNTAPLSGWIIDLTKDRGGKMSNESLALAPLFENSLIGISCNNQNVFRNIRCEDGYFYFGEFKMDSLIYESQLKNKGKKIAVLVSEKTSSAGEFLALAFDFQEKSRIFGSETKGLTSHCRLFGFKSNAKLLLAVEKYCDKNKAIIQKGIIPDVECPEEESLPQAIAWIKSTP